jgi:hypothetical protein
MKKSLLFIAVLATLSSFESYAEETAPAADAAAPAAAPAAVPAAAAAAPAAAAPAAAAPAPLVMNGPGMNYPLVGNANPLFYDMGGAIGKIYVSGAVTGLAATNDGVAGYAGIANYVTHNSIADVSNAQVMIQKIDGPVQFFVDAGAYSIPVVGQAYARASHQTSDTYGELPTAYIKLVPNDTFSFQTGKLPTLLGAEYTFTFENTNIQRGLLWNQENVFTRGVQANYAKGPVSVSVQLGDGFYTKDWKWLTASASYTINDSNTVSVAGGGNFDKTTTNNNSASSFVSDAAANSQVYNLIYKYTKGPITIQPYLQYTYVPTGEAGMNYTGGGHTYGGAVLANYAVNDAFNVGARLEYIKETGNVNIIGAYNNGLLGYGTNSPKAWSATITPTYQYKNAFIRGELSYVKVDSGQAPYLFGSSQSDSQVTAMIETGFLF